MSSAINLFPRVHSNVEDTAKVIAAQAEQRQAAQPVSERDRQREYAAQARELENLETQLRYRQDCVKVLTPVVAGSKKHVKELRATWHSWVGSEFNRVAFENIKNTLEANAANVGWEAQALGPQIIRAEELLANETKRLECSTKLVESLTKLIKEFHERHDTTYLPAKATDKAHDRRPGSFSRGAGQSVQNWLDDAKI